MFLAHYFSGKKKLSRYESARRKEVIAWKRRESEKDVLTKLLDPVSRRAGHFIDQVLPKSSVAFLMARLDHMAEMLAIDGDDLLNDAFVRNLNIYTWSDLQNQPLEIADSIADHVVKDAKKMAIGMGVATGAGGLIVALGGIPLLLAGAMTVIHRVGLAYGYCNTRELEKGLAMHILALSMAEDHPQKSVAREDSQFQIQQSLVDQALREATGKALQRIVLGFEISSVVPGLGMALNAYMSRAFIKQAGRTAQRVFQEQWLLDHRGVSCAI